MRQGLTNTIMKNKQTSSKVATKASKILKNEKASKDCKSVVASALAQSKNRIKRR